MNGSMHKQIIQKKTNNYYKNKFYLNSFSSISCLVHVALLYLVLCVNVTNALELFGGKSYH